jgi:hypothetical protein
MKSWFGVFFLSWSLYAYEHTLVISSVFKDEAPFFREWIEYHKMLGVEHFRLYNNDSTDNYLEVLAPYIAKGDVTLIDWPSGKEDLKNWVYLTQWPACKDAIENFKGVTKWLAIIDVDEFILPIEDPDLQMFLKGYEEYPAVVLNWQCFGTSCVQDILPGKLMIEMLTLKAEDNSIRNIAVKSILQPESVDLEKMCLCVPHTFYYLENRLPVFPDKTTREETMDIFAWEIKPFGAVINHYVHRTEKYFWRNKIAKKQRMDNGGVVNNQEYLKQWYLDCNAVEDEKIFRFVPELRKRLFQKGGEGELLAVEGIPVGAVDGAVGIFNSDAVDW